MVIKLVVPLLLFSLSVVSAMRANADARSLCIEEKISEYSKINLQPEKPIWALLEDAPIETVLSESPELFPYLVAKFNLDPNLSSQKAKEVEQTILSGLGEEDRAVLKKLDAHVAVKLSDPVLRRKIVQSFESRMSRLRLFGNRIRNLPKVSKKIGTVIREDLTTETMDANLYAFRGYHTDIGVKEMQQRLWNKVPLADIHPSQIKGMSVDEFASILLFAKEVEDPIEWYSVESGSGLRYLLSNLARFMGRNREEYEYFKGDPNSKEAQWCTGSWCDEEKRHGAYFGRLYTLVTGRKLPPDNPNGVGKYVDPTLKFAQEHLIARQGTETSASAAYELLLAHSEGPLHDAIRNVLNDELKHLTIFSTVGRYINGERPWGRRLGIIKVQAKYATRHKGVRTQLPQQRCYPPTSRLKSE